MHAFPVAQIARGVLACECLSVWPQFGPITQCMHTDKEALYATRIRPHELVFADFAQFSLLVQRWADCGRNGMVGCIAASSSSNNYVVLTQRSCGVEEYILFIYIYVQLHHPIFGVGWKCIKQSTKY